MIFVLKTMKILKVIKKSHFQNETGCKTVIVKMSFIRVEIKNHFHILIKWIRTLPRFKTEDRGNSEKVEKAYSR